MSRHTFTCIDGHTCGNPVRLVAGGGPLLKGNSMMERRADFLANHDWIRKGLMFEPRGHDVMSGTILYEPMREDTDCALLFIETSGCLYMCGHGTIGTVTMAIENGLMTPKTPGIVNLDVPAGKVVAEYTMDGEYVESVRLTNVPSFLHSTDLEIEAPGLGKLKVDVAYGGNFYCIVDPQENFSDIADVTVGDLLRWSPALRQAMNERYEFVHPENENIRGCTHILWTGKPTKAENTARNAVFYGDKAIDRSPCGTGTSARMAQWFGRGRLKVGDAFNHESIIGSVFNGRVERAVEVGTYDGIVPSIAGWARQTGLNTIFIDDRDPFAHGFSLV